MSEAPAGLLDTSVFIARESGRPLAALPALSAVSVVTIGELAIGVMAAVDAGTRARRAETLALAREADPVGLGEAELDEWARLVVACRRAGIHRVVKLTDALIAATAIARGVPVVTRDEDYDRIAAAHPPLEVVRV